MIRIGSVATTGPEAQTEWTWPDVPRQRAAAAADSPPAATAGFLSPSSGKSAGCGRLVWTVSCRSLAVLIWKAPPGGGAF